MAKKGALKSTLIVTSDELKVNGGRWLLQSGPAIRVRGFNSSSIGDRKVIGGDALPIYILAETDARVNGGQFLLKGGQPIQVTDVIGSARGVIQGKAIPVWPVDDDGNFDPNFSGVPFPSDIPNLLLHVAGDLGLSLSNGDPITLWPDQSGNGNDLTTLGGNAPTFIENVINSKPVIRGNGVDEWMSVAFGGGAVVQPYTVCFVGQFVNLDLGGSAFRVFISGEGPNWFAAWREPNAAPTWNIFASAQVNTGDAADINPHIFTIVYDGVTSFIRKDGAQIGAGNAGGDQTTGLTVFSDRDPGFGFPSNYDHAEVCFYSAELTALEIAQWEVYASSKYSIAI